MDATQAQQLINELIADADAVRVEGSKFDAWWLKCETVIDRIFGPESKQLRGLQSVSFQFHGISNIGDNRPYREAFLRGLDKSKEVLRQMLWEIDQFGLFVARGVDDPEAALAALELICDRFHAIVCQLRHRRDNRSTLDVSDEYDAQDLLHALLRLHFDDIRPEEWTPSYAGKSARIDFLLKREQLVIEVKKSRHGLDAKKVGEELIIDIARYKGHSNCKTLICFVYDPDNRIANPAGLERDLAQQSDEFTVKVIISPKN